MNFRWLLLIGLMGWTGGGLFAQDETQADAGLQVPDSYVEQVKKTQAFMELSLQDAIRLALTNNLQLEIENYNEDLNRERIVGTRGFYDPVLQFGFGWNSSERPNTSVLDAGSGIPTTIFKRWTFNTNLQQNVPWGGALNLALDNNRFTTNSAFSFINPQYGSNFSLNLTQPLLRGFRETQTERQLKLFNLDTRISDSQFEQRVSEILQDVENQFWELVFAIQNHEARRKSLELAAIQHENNERRVQIGVMAPIEITSSRAEVATREQEMIQSEVQIINSQNALKRLLAPDPNAGIWNLSLLPSDLPQLRDVTIDMQQAIRTALENRPELDQIRLQVEKTDVDRKYWKRQGKPVVNLVAGVISAGTAGDVFQTALIDTTGDGVPDTPAGFEPNPNSPFFGNFSNSLGQAFGFDFLTYNIGFNLEIPLRNRSNEAQLAETAISERQLLSQLKDVQQQIMVDVRNAYEGLATRRKGLEAARVARELTEEQLDGENKRFLAGLSTNFEVLRYQRDLAEAQVRELRAEVDYQLALTALQKAMFTIVSDSDIVLARRDDD